MRDHVYRHYESSGIDVCQNCAMFKKDIEAIPHYIFESGYCDPKYCDRCKAEDCTPLPLPSIKST